MMHHLKRLATSVAVAAAPAAMIALGAGTAAAQPATPSPSPTPNPQGATTVTIDTANRNCAGVAQGDYGTGQGKGSAVINLVGPRGPNAPTGPNAPGQKVVADVNITNAEPNSQYGVRLIQTPENVNDCGNYAGPYDATLQTDASGTGHVNVQEPLLPGANDAFVILNNEAANTTDYYTSPDVTIS